MPDPAPASPRIAPADAAEAPEPRRSVPQSVPPQPAPPQATATPTPRTPAPATRSGSAAPPGRMPGPGWERELKARELLMSDSDTESNWSSRPPSPQEGHYPRHRLSGMQSKDATVVQCHPPGDEPLALLREVSPFGPPPAQLTADQLSNMHPAPLRSVPPDALRRGSGQGVQHDPHAPSTHPPQPHPQQPSSHPHPHLYPHLHRVEASPVAPASTRTTVSPAKPSSGPSAQVASSVPPTSPLAPPGPQRSPSSQRTPTSTARAVTGKPPVTHGPSGPGPNLSTVSHPSTVPTLANKSGATPSAPAPAPAPAPAEPAKKPGMLKRMMGAGSKPSASTASNAHAHDEITRSVQAMSLAHSQQSHPYSPSHPGSQPGSQPSSQPPSQTPSRSSSVHHHEQGGSKRSPPSESEPDALTASALAHLEAPAAAAAAARERERVRKAGVRAPLSAATGKEPIPPKDKLKEKEKDHDAKSTTSSTLRDMIRGGPKLTRRGSSASGGSKATESKKASAHGGDAVSLLKKYGVCEKAAIGKGATAVVRLAHKWDRSTEKLYAVKEFRKRRKNETEKEYVKKLTSEFCISSTLHHINVVETVDLVQDENKHWCEVMEFCAGGDLYAAIKRGGLSQLEVECYFKQMIHGIVYLHSMGVAHRDIKPENLLLDAHGRVKITDFGVSDIFRLCWEAKCSLSKGLCGSEPYIAPEQFEHSKYDARLVDVWAAAIVFYCMQFQELPWRVAKMSDPTFNEFVHSYHSASAPGPLASLAPRECRPLIKRMLCPDPEQRCTVEEIMKDKWFASIQACGAELARNHKHSIVLTIT